MKLEKYLSDREKKPSVFAREIGVSASTITRVLNGQRGVGMKTLSSIIKGTNGLVTAEDFFEVTHASVEAA